MQKKASRDLCGGVPCLKVLEKETAGEPTEKVWGVDWHPAEAHDICGADKRRSMVAMTMSS